jgi:hypothetical protein
LCDIYRFRNEKICTSEELDTYQNQALMVDQQHDPRSKRATHLTAACHIQVGNPPRAVQEAPDVEKWGNTEQFSSSVS